MRHAQEMWTKGAALPSWPLIFRPLHDALIEDSLDKATISLGQTVEKAAHWPMSAVVRTLRGVRKN